MYKIKTFIVATPMMSEPEITICSKIDRTVNAWLSDNYKLGDVEMKNITVSPINETSSLVTIFYKE